MTTPNKIAANRANAAKSTGPTSDEGKRRSSRNARRHGLTIPLIADPNWTAEVDVLARAITEHDGCGIEFELAKRVAVAHLDLLRVRKFRQHLITDAIANRANFETPEQRILRERIIHAKLPAASTKRLMAAIDRKPTEQLEQAMIIGGLARELERLDRYEYRALGRRRRAMHEYDARRLDASKN